MSAKVTLTITEGKLSGRQYIFDSRTSCIIGRASDCNIKLPDDKNHSTISRYHCLLDINPPDIRIRDFGSRNGTYVNNKKIGQRQDNQAPDEAANEIFPEFDLKDNDEIKLSNTVFNVSIESQPEEIKIKNFFPATIDFDKNPTEAPNLLEYIKKFLGLAKAGNSNLLAIKGYDIIQILGKGGFGEVYLAQHNHSQKFIALKVMLPQVAASEYAVNLFLRETENIKVLRHPHVVNLIDYGYSEGIFFFTMEYCQGGTVEDLMRQQQGKLPIDIATAIILQVLDGLEYSHNVEIPYVKLRDGNFGKGKGLVHRDLKPGNIFLTYQDGKITAKIGDYGLSKAFDFAGLSGQTRTGSRVGTPVFIPRQQVLEFKYAKPEVDIWAAAASLYYMLTGCFPRDFTGNDIFLAVLRNKPIPIRDRDPNIPQKLAEIIDLALVEEPEIHFKSAKAFKQALLNVL
ncbi:protein kinase domain-containing protein [Calothrix sp. CCY 0018]|uniref:protein kinase domain-containing protein n=1 Tax=Calothrix sp. CCY 0018 TaxID=3103864 RepID=UPI0039C690BE